MNEIVLDLYTRLTSRKFLAGLFGIMLLLGDNLGYIGLDSETRKQILTLILGYIFVEGSADAVRAYKE